VRNRITSYERQVEMDMARHHQLLASRAAEARKQVENLQHMIINNDRRLSIITSSELPNAHNSLNSLQAQLSNAQMRFSSDAANSQRADQDLQSFMRQVQWEQKTQAVSQASAVLSQRRDALSNAEARRRSAESTIAHCQSERTRLANQLAAQQRVLTQSETRLGVVQGSLQPYEQGRANIEAEKADLMNQISGVSIQFEGQLPR
jgi:chromosome segregation ATPase